MKRIDHYVAQKKVSALTAAEASNQSDAHVDAGEFPVDIEEADHEHGVVSEAGGFEGESGDLY